MRKHVLGVMSGTSLDGVDLASIIFEEVEGKTRFDIQCARTIPYPSSWVEKLSEAVHYPKEQLQELNSEYTRYLADVINSFIQAEELQDLDFISSHGHTILHNPKEGYTLQIGNLPELATLTQHTVVCDFRVQDVHLGGQGAPLVPIGDQLLFSEYDYCLNLGGFSNISFDAEGTRMAYDISPVNTVLNFYAQQLGHPYDKGGELAKEGILNQELFEELNALEFYHKSYPKSLGVEFLYTTVFPILQRFSATEVLSTFTSHIAYQISRQIQKEKARVLVTGGGAYNTFLMDQIRSYCLNAQIIVPEPKLVEFKEALIFGYLGYLKIQGKNNVLSSVTGASRDHSSGVIYVYL